MIPGIAICTFKQVVSSSRRHRFALAGNLLESAGSVCGMGVCYRASCLDETAGCALRLYHLLRAGFCGRVDWAPHPGSHAPQSGQAPSSTPALGQVGSQAAGCLLCRGGHRPCPEAGQGHSWALWLGRAVDEALGLPRVTV